MKLLDDLAAFAGPMYSSGDMEPEAEMMKVLGRSMDREELLWLIAIYNTVDFFDEAWLICQRWPTPRAWSTAGDREAILSYRIAHERRNLYGGRLMRRMTAYVTAVQTYGWSQEQWALAGLAQATDPWQGFVDMMEHVQRIWGVGRQTAFQWVEFLMKAAGLPIKCADAYLWESSGPRKALELIFGPLERREYVDEAAKHAKDYLRDRKVELSWEDFETAICDFKGMMLGNYYPGKHLAAVRGEIDALPEADQALILPAWCEVIPEPWRGIVPGVDKLKLTVYRDTGEILSGP